MKHAGNKAVIRWTTRSDVSALRRRPLRNANLAEVSGPLHRWMRMKRVRQSQSRQRERQRRGNAQARRCNGPRRSFSLAAGYHRVRSALLSELTAGAEKIKAGLTFRPALISVKLI